MYLGCKYVNIDAEDVEGKKRRRQAGRQTGRDCHIFLQYRQHDVGRFKELKLWSSRAPRYTAGTAVRSSIMTRCIYVCMCDSVLRQDRLLPPWKPDRFYYAGSSYSAGVLLCSSSQLLYVMTTGIGRDFLRPHDIDSLPYVIHRCRRIVFVVKVARAAYPPPCLHATAQRSCLYLSPEDGGPSEVRCNRLLDGMDPRILGSVGRCIIPPRFLLQRATLDCRRQLGSSCAARYIYTNER